MCVDACVVCVLFIFLYLHMLLLFLFCFEGFSDKSPVTDLKWHSDVYQMIVCACACMYACVCWRRGGYACVCVRA